MGGLADVRRAFLVCRVAAEKVLDGLEVDVVGGAEKRPVASVTVRDVVEAVKMLKESPQLKCLARCTDAEALVVVSLASLLVSTGREEGGVGVTELRQKMAAVAAGLGRKEYLPVPPFPALIDLLNRMNDSRVIVLETPAPGNARHVAAGDRRGTWPLVMLNGTDPFEVEDALGTGKHHLLVERFLKKKKV